MCRLMFVDRYVSVFMFKNHMLNKSSNVTVVKCKEDGEKGTGNSFNKVCKSYSTKFPRTTALG